jgi:small-conductance mechanosensitive channel
MAWIRLQVSLLFFTLCVPLLAHGALNEGLGQVPPGVDRGTPLAAVKGFTESVRRGEYARAAHYLDLEEVPAAEQAERGAQLARRLKFVLDRKLPGALSAGKVEAGSGQAVVDLGSVVLQGQPYPVRLAGVEGAWVFDSVTVQAIDKLYAAYGPVLGDTLPPLFFKRPVLGLEPWQWLGLLVLLTAGAALALVLERLLLALLARLARWSPVGWDDALVEAGRGPLRLLVFALLLGGGSFLLLLPPSASYGARRLVTSLLIVSVAWFILRTLRVSDRYIHEKMTGEGVEVGRVRGVRTQLSVLRSVFEAATYVVAVALLLMQFETVRNVGVSLLASAGIAGLVLGLAAQKSISSLLAGIQLSITQPIRIGDTVVVQSEWGTVEEINLTYVVIQVWDQRRLVVPIVEFLDKPFQNWSKGGTHMVGEVLLQVDYTTDMEALRQELRRILESEGRELWDGKVCSAVVLEVLDRTLKVRVLVSTTPAQLFDLRCLVRERLVAFLRNRPEWLPATRTEARTPPPPPAEPAAGEKPATAAASPGVPRA